MKLRKPILYKLVLLFLLLCLSLQLIPRLIFKTPSTHVGWRDPDYNLNVKNVKNEVVVLRWTPFFRDYGTSPEILTSESCPHVSLDKESEKFTACRITFDRRYLSISDALVFHSYDMMWEELPKERLKEQIWVYHQMECPIYTKLNLQGYSNVFNWTMTYRRDSDVYFPYGKIISSQKDLDLNLTDKIQQKTNLVTWIVSSCDSYSKREHLVDELQKYIPVDVYGWCGNKCPNEGNCYKWASAKYKFYLSFENALCSDYITEKFFEAMKHDIVPVVYGGSSSVDYSAIAPEGSYIDSRKFKSAKDLATYLLYLDKDENEYLKYFEWKSKYQVVGSEGWCNLCQKVFEHFQVVPERRNYKLYKDLWKWWNYLDYNTNRREVELEESTLNVVSEQSFYNKQGSPACLQAPEFLTRGKPDFEPGFINGRLYGKVWEWAQG